MADCYWHGYSGGPGSCGICDEEDRRGLSHGSLSGFDQSITCAAWKRGEPPPNEQPNWRSVQLDETHIVSVPVGSHQCDGWTAHNNEPCSNIVRNDGDHCAAGHPNKIRHGSFSTDTQGNHTFTPISEPSYETDVLAASGIVPEQASEDVPPSPLLKIRRLCKVTDQSPTCPTCGKPSIMLPNVTSRMGKLSPGDILLYYDGPVVFTCRNDADQTYLAIAVAEEHEGEIYLYIPISEDRLALVRSGQLTLHDAVAMPESETVFVVRAGYKGFADSIVELPTSRIPTRWLPDKDSALEQ